VILLPAAIFLNRLATSGSFGAKFYLIQGLELFAGAVNLFLMSMNMRDGLKMTGKLRSKKNN
jgi:multisubunit Na+/H+ antiporter MnhC subunit